MTHSASGQTDGALDSLDEVKPDKQGPSTQVRALAPKNEDELIEALRQRGIRSYRKRNDLPHVPRSLRRELRPELADMAKVSTEVAQRLSLGETLKRNAVKAATDQLRGREVHTELTEDKHSEQSVEIITDRQILSREAIAILRLIPQIEDEDVRIIVQALAERLAPVFSDEGITFPESIDLARRARDAAFWVIRKEADTLIELIQSIVSEFTVSAEAEPLPDAMLFPLGLPLVASRKNIYGVMPPTPEQRATIGDLLGIDQQAAMAERTITFDAGVWRQAAFDGVSTFNTEELSFAKSLDEVDFVVWWHRNPDRKPYSVAIVRGDHQNYFYPDFVVCVEHVAGEPPAMRLIETKENTKDAARKARRIPRDYGKILFVTRDKERLRAINDDGSLGSIIDFDTLDYVQQWMRETQPSA